MFGLRIAKGALAQRCQPDRDNGMNTSPRLKPRDCHFGCEQCPLVWGVKMKSWYEKLPDWRMVVTWLILTFVAAVAYFLPAERLVDAFID